MIRNNRGSAYRPKPPRRPIKLNFGVIPDKNNPTQPVEVVKPGPVQKEEPVSVVGTLDLKGIDYSTTAPLSSDFIERIRTNLRKIYLSGLSCEYSKLLVDHENGELIVEFPFDRQKIERIKGLDQNERMWDPDSKKWKVFTGSFDDVFDILGQEVRLTESAYNAICDFISTPYYAHIGPGKLGKIAIRESWFEDLAHRNISLTVKFGSNHWLKNPDPATLENKDSTADDLMNEIAFWKNAVHEHQYHRTPLKHHIEGIEYLVVNNAAALFDEMGCGKSFQIANSIALLLKHNQISRALVVTSKPMRCEWLTELESAVGNGIGQLETNALKRNRELLKNKQVYLCHYESMKAGEESISEWLNQGDCLLVFDESQRIKKLGAAITLTALRLARLAQRRIISTPFPIPNRPVDLFAQYLAMDQGETFGRRLSAFKSKFCVMEQRYIRKGFRSFPFEICIAARDTDELSDRIAKTSLRRLRADITDLPDFNYKDLYVELEPEQARIYANIREQAKSPWNNSPSHIFQSLSRTSSNPKLIDSKYDGFGPKLNCLNQLMNDILSEDNRKVIVCTNYVENVESIVNLLNGEIGKRGDSAVGFHGNLNSESKSDAVSRFKNERTCRVFVATLSSFTAISDLNSSDPEMQADTLVHVDFSLDTLSYQKAKECLHSGHHRGCLVVHLIASRTVDEKVRYQIIEKINSQNSIVDKKEKEYKSVSELVVKNPNPEIVDSDLLKIFKSILELDCEDDDLPVSSEPYNTEEDICAEFGPDATDLPRSS